MTTTTAIYRKGIAGMNWLLLAESDLQIQAAGIGAAVGAVIVAIGAAASRLWKTGSSVTRGKNKDALAALWTLYNNQQAEIATLKQRSDERDAAHEEEMANCRRDHFIAERRYASAYERIKYHEELLQKAGIMVRPWNPDGSTLHGPLTNEVELHGPPGTPTEQGDA